MRASYYPYGEERDAIVGDDRDKFATYWEGVLISVFSSVLREAGGTDEHRQGTD